MPRCLNKATLIGYLGADPEIRTLPDGARAATFALATTRRWNDREGAQQERSQWHRITVWDSLPSTFAFVEAYARKGDRVYVEGEIEYRSYEDRDGVNRWSTEIRGADVLAAGTRSAQVDAKPAARPRTTTRTTTARKTTARASAR
jgi:single-strand DNA-binding protein